MSDMFHLENITAVLRALDYQYGGGACRDAVVAQTRWAQQLLTADYTPQVGQRLILALADLHNLAGWTSFDSGMYSAARLHFARALEQAKHVGDSSLVANVLYRMGKLHLYRGLYREALKCFQLGQIAAQDSGCKLTVAMLCANQAWSYALLGDVVPALNSISQAKDEFAHADRDTAPAWVHFFGQADLHASEGMVYASMPETTEAQLTSAVDSLRLSFGIRDDAMARSRTLELITLATSLLKLNSLDEGVALGHEAVDITTRLRSVRTAERLELLQVEAASHRTDDATRDLGERIATLRPV
jgi:tetratricopeptide (TPR) repeat protein